MKWRLTTVLAFLFLLMPAFVSCVKDDDEPDESEQPADVEKIAGVYSGSLGYTVMGFVPGKIEGTYELKISKDASDATLATVVLPECTFTPPIPQAGSYTIPSLTLEGVKVTEKGNVYSLSTDDFSIKDGETSYTGKLTGKVVGKDVKMEFLMRPGSMPMDINFTFTGTQK